MADKRFLFDTTVFAQNDFDAHNFVTNCLAISPAPSTLALESLRADLKLYDEKLKGFLVELLNREYADFIGLSSSLVGTSESIASITNHVNALKLKSVGASHHLRETLAEMEGKLADRYKNSMKRARLETLSQIYETVRKVKGLLLEDSEDEREMDVSDTKRDSLASPVTPALRKRDNALPSTLAHSSNSASEASVAFFMQLLEQKDHGYDDSEKLVWRAAKLERMARELNKLHVLMNKNEQFVLVQNISGDVKRLDRQFEKRVERLFLTALEQQHEIALEHCLRAFSLSDRIPLAETIVRERIVRPLVQKEVTRENLSTIHTDTSRASSMNRLRFMFDSLIDQLNRSCVLLLRVSYRDYLLQPSSHPVPIDLSVSTQFDFLSNSIWREVMQTFTSPSVASSLFAFGVPDIFHHNYTESVRFVKNLEQLLDSSTRDPDNIDQDFHAKAESKHNSTSSTRLLLRFREHSLFQDFRRRWNLPMYFQLRFQAIAQQLEGVLVVPAPAGPGTVQAGISRPPSMPSSSELLVLATSSAPPVLLLDTTRAAWAALSSCWSALVWLPELSSSFFKLSLQCCARFALWIEQGLGLGLGNSDTPADTESKSDPRKANSSAAWTGVSIHLHALIQLDLERLHTRIRHELVERMVLCLVEASNMPDASKSDDSFDKHAHVEHLVQAGWDDALQRLNSVRTALTDRIATDISAQCISVLSAVPQIRRAYQFQQSAAKPTTASTYVPNILRPVLQFLGGAPQESALDLPFALSAVLSDSQRQQLINMCCNKVVDKYWFTVEELLTALSKAEASIKRFSKHSTSASDDSAVERIRQQLFLDVTEFSRQLRDLGAADSCGHLPELQRFVAPPAR